VPVLGDKGWLFFCSDGELLPSQVFLRLKSYMVWIALRGTSVRAVERHLTYGITQRCYLSANKGERALLIPAKQTGT